MGSQSSNKDWSSVPYDLEDFPWWNFRNINFKIGVSIIPSPPIESADDGHNVEPSEIGKSSVVYCIEHIDLSPTYVGFVLIMDSVLVEPVVKVGLEVDMVSEISWPGRRNKKLRLVGYGVVVIQFFR